MAGSLYGNNNDSSHISELLSLNEDISDDFLDQLQNQLSSGKASFSNNEVNENDDSTLFEEMVELTENTETAEQEVSTIQEEDTADKVLAEKEETVSEPVIEEPVKKEEVSVNQNFDDNFIKKYKAKLNKKAQASFQKEDNQYNTPEPSDDSQAQPESIETLSQGNISERPLTPELKDYNDSLDFLDGNVKYSKYVIYIDPQNVDFIDGLTVKERKNLINRILRQQDDIAITKQRFKIIQTVIRHVIVAVLTVAISIPVIYHVINASLEATIDNHRNAQTTWHTLYKENGKIMKH